MYENPDLLCLACLQPKTNLSVCPNCGWFPGQQPHNPLYLEPGTVVQSPYQVARVLGYGGFGVTYLGWDANLQIRVAIKEFLPRECVFRTPGSGLVFVQTEEKRPLFAKGLNGFLHEARTLARFQQHPGIVSVLAFFRAMGTGYMVMEYVEGVTLADYIKQRGRLKWQQTLEIFMQIMDALRYVHQAGLLHRDVAPDNIYLCQDGRVKLLDFGAAHIEQDISDSVRRSANVFVKSGFAPQEQYSGSTKQGAWSDIYSVAASMYYCLTGQIPPDALDRGIRDTLSPPAVFGAEIPDGAEQALMNALALNSLQRPQSIEILQSQLIKASGIGGHGRGVFLNDNVPDSSSRKELSLTSPADRVAETVFLRYRGWMLGGLVVCLMVFFAQVPQRQTVQTTLTTQPQPMLQPATNETVMQDEALMVQARQAEAAELKRQQAAALQRFEENNRQQSLPAQEKQPDARQSEHWRSLCAEWGATMECGNIK